MKLRKCRKTELICCKTLLPDDITFSQNSPVKFVEHLQKAKPFGSIEQSLSFWQELLEQYALEPTNVNNLQ